MKRESFGGAHDLGNIKRDRCRDPLRGSMEAQAGD